MPAICCILMPATYCTLMHATYCISHVDACDLLYIDACDVLHIDSCDLLHIAHWCLWLIAHWYLRLIPHWCPRLIAHWCLQLIAHCTWMPATCCTLMSATYCTFHIDACDLYCMSKTAPFNRFYHGTHRRPQKGKTGIWPLEIGSRNQKSLENLKSRAWFRSIDFILAMSLFAGMALTLHKSQFHSSGVMHWWTCNSLIFALLSAESSCETCEATVLLLIFIVSQTHSNASLVVDFNLR